MYNFNLLMIFDDYRQIFFYSVKVNSLFCFRKSKVEYTSCFFFPSYFSLSVIFKLFYFSFEISTCYKSRRKLGKNIMIFFLEKNTLYLQIEKI